jgi:hypothetical protein
VIKKDEIDLAQQVYDHAREEYRRRLAEATVD